MFRPKKVIVSRNIILKYTKKNDNTINLILNKTSFLQLNDTEK